MKKFIAVMMICALGLMSFAQQNPDFERITFEPEVKTALVTTYNPDGSVTSNLGDSIIIDEPMPMEGDTIFPPQVTDFPPVDAETDSTGYVHFNFNRPYPYMKFINGQRILLMTADQSREIASDVESFKLGDSLIVSYEFRVAYLQDLNSQKDSTILDLKGAIEEKDNQIAAHESILANKDRIINEKQESINLYLEDIETKNKTINRQKWLIGGSLGLAVGLPLAILIFGN